MRVDSVEELVMSPNPQFAGWRHFRVEYEDGKEGSVWIPPGLSESSLTIMDKITLLLSS